MVAIGYLLPFVIALMPMLDILDMKYGPTLFYCWIDDKNLDDSPTAMPVQNLLLMFAPVGIIFVFVLYIYTRTYLYVRKLPITMSGIGAGRLFIYPLIVFIVFVPPVIEYCFKAGFSRQLVIWQICLLHSIGFFNALAYAWHRCMGSRKKQNRNQDQSMISMREEDLREEVERSSRFESHKTHEHSIDTNNK